MILKKTAACVALSVMAYANYLTFAHAQDHPTALELLARHNADIALSIAFKGKDRLFISRSGSPLELVNTPKNGEAATPKFSPNGQKLAFSEHDGHDFEIMVLDLASGQTQQITNDDLDDIMPSWSPNSNRLTWTKTPCRCIEGGNDSEIWAAQLSPDVAPVRMTHNNRMDVYPVFSSTGDTIIFESGDVDELFGLFSTSWPDAKETEILYEPKLSGNGIPSIFENYLAFERADASTDNQYFNAIIDLDGSVGAYFRPTGWAAPGANPTPRFSPNGAYLASHRYTQDRSISEVVLTPFAPGSDLPIAPQKETTVSTGDRWLMLPLWSANSELLLAEDRKDKGVFVVSPKGLALPVPLPGAGRGQKFMEIWNHDIH